MSARLSRLLAVTGLLLLAGLGSATSASAHSALDRSDPAAGEKLDVLPERITLTFNQNVSGLGAVLKVTGPDGNVTDGSPRVADNTVRQPIEPGSPAGAYTVVWRVTSADGHPISGTFRFTAAAGSEPEAAATEPAETEPAETTTPAAAETSEPSAAAGVSETAEESSSGPDPVLLWLLIALVALVVAVGIMLAARRSGPPSGADQT